MDETALYVSRGETEPDDLRTTIQDVLVEIATGEGELATEAQAAGLETGEEVQITVEEAGQNFLPAAALVLVFVKAGGAAAGTTLAKKLWSDVLLPEVRRRRGANAVGDVVDQG